MPEVKICGNRRREDIEYASGADYLGFIIQIRESPRSLTIEEAKPLMAQAQGYGQTVAVVNVFDGDFLSDMCSALDPDYVQLQAELPSSKLLELKDLLGVQVIAHVSPTQGAVERADALTEVADVIAVDTVVDGAIGGTGKTHDWELSRRVRDAVYPAKLMLSGGLNCQNVESAIAAVMPSIVDVSSGVEENGWKSKELVSSFIRKAKEAGNG